MKRSRGTLCSQSRVSSGYPGVCLLCYTLGTNFVPRSDLNPINLPFGNILGDLGMSAIDKKQNKHNS